MKGIEYIDHEQSNLAYAIRLTMVNPPRVPPVDLEKRIVEELVNPPNNYHVQAARYENELGLMVYTHGIARSTVDHAIDLKRAIDLYCTDTGLHYTITPTMPLEPEESMTFGEKLKELRRGKYTQVQLASELDLTQGYLSAVESDNESPSSETIRKIANLLEYDESILRCMAKKPPEDILETISHHPYLIKTLSKHR